MERVWLVTGSSGQVGSALVSHPPAGVHVVAPSRAELDLSSVDLDVSPLLAAYGITAIVNCGAYTKVDQAEDEAELAFRVNGDGPAVLARAARGAGIPIVHLSTDYVFSGDKPVPYVEGDETGPRTAYGRSKLAGEDEVRTSGARHAILRTAWVFSAGGSNFVRTMLGLARTRDSVSVVADQFGCPTHAGDLAAAVATVTRALEDGSCSGGVWHVVNAGETSWHGLADHVFARAAAYGAPRPALHPIASADYPVKAARPANSRLCTGKFQADFSLALRDWRTAVDEAVDEIIRREGAAQA